MSEHIPTSRWKLLCRKFAITNLLVGLIAHSILSAFLLVVLLWVWSRSTPATRVTAGSEKQALELLHGLKRNLHTQDAAQRMQSIFPEGACFTWSLYGWGWSNIAAQVKSQAVHDVAIREIRAALDGQASPDATSPFGDTQVRNGVF